MKNNLILFALLFIIANSFAQNPPLAWAKKIEAVDQNSSSCNISLNSIDNAGAMYSSGNFTDTLRPDDNQPLNYLIGNSNSPSGAFMKYDVNGNLIWANVLKAKNGDFFVTDLDVDQYHNVYILCYGVYADTVDFDPGIGVQNQILSGGNDFFIAKYDVNGNFLWTTILNVINGSSFSPLNRPNTIKVDANQNIYIGGQFENIIELNPTNVTYTIANPSGPNCNCIAGFYAKYDSIGNILWGYADGNNASVNDIDVNDANGKIIIGATPDLFTAQTLRLCDAAGNTLNNTSFGNITVNSVKFDTQGSIFFSGHFKGSGNDFDWGPNTFDMSASLAAQGVGFVGKYDSSANFQWAVQYDPTNNPNYRASFYTISMDADSNPLLAYGEGDGNTLNRGFFKIDGGSGFAIWPSSIFSTGVGLGGADILSSPVDGSVVFAGGAGFSGNTITTFDVAPDPNVVSNLTGTGYWSFLAKYGNCIASPSTPGTISGATSLCNLNSVSYSVPLQNGVSTYTWTLPAGWSGTSTSNSITVTPSGNGGTLSVVASNACGSSNQQTLNIVFGTVPNVAANATASSICLGNSVTLSGGGATSYTWSNGVVNGVPFQPTATQNYTVTGTQGACSATASINIAVIPLIVPSVSISANPGSPICAGTSVTFTATPTNGGASPSYQWKLNGNNVGTNSSSYTSAALANSDVVTCVITSNATCASPTTATSNAITMSVNAVLIPSVSISANPGNTFCAGTSVTFTATPTNGGAGPSYQWKLNGNNVGTNSSSYTSAALANSDVVTCVPTSNATCASPTTATSNAVTMSVNAVLVPLVSISANPGSPICAGTSVTFTATPANGGNSPSYQWKLNGNNVGTNSSSYSSAALANNDMLTCLLTSNATCASPTTATSNAITMSVNAVLIPTVSISANPGSPICAGTSVTFTATPTNGGAGPSYQWKLNGNNVGTNSSSYTNASLANIDTVICLLTSSESCAVPLSAASSEVVVIVNSSVTASVSITATPGSEVCTGEVVVFNSTLSNEGSSPLFVWKKNNVIINGANASTYSSAQLVNIDAIKCEMTSNTSCVQQPVVVSNEVTMTVNPIPDVSVTQSGNTLSVPAAALYQWFDCTNLTDMNGANTLSYTAANNGHYAVRVSNSFGCADTSDCVQITGVGLAEVGETGVRIYPNPAADYIEVSLMPGSTSNVLNIFGVAGQAVAIYPLNEAYTRINIADLAAGIYTLTLKDNYRSSFARFVKQ